MIECKDCKYWDCPADYEEDPWSYMGKCTNQHIISKDINDHNFIETKVEISCIMATYEDSETFYGLETAAGFGCIHASKKDLSKECN